MSLKRFNSLAQKACAAMDQAMKNVEKFHKEHNLTLAVWKDGKVVAVPPKKMK